MTFSAAASGQELLYRWQTRADAASAWEDLPGASGQELTVTAQASDHGRQYRCGVSNSAGTVWSDTAVLTVELATPTLVSASASGNGIVFKWNAVSGAVKYRVYRKYAGVNWTAVANVAATGYTDTNVTRGTVYTYTVRCLSADGQTCVSGFDAAGKSAFVALPTPELQSVNSSGSTVYVRWSAVPGAARYRVYRRNGDSNRWNFVADTSALLFEDANVANGNYYYTVCCLSADGAEISGYNATGLPVTVEAGGGAGASEQPIE